LLAATHTFDLICDQDVHIQGATQVLRNQDMEGVIGCLTGAVALYEEHPSYVHDPPAHIRDLLVFIPFARAISQTPKRPHDDLDTLEGRAKALRVSQLH
jgi:hypothetical protein